MQTNREDVQARIEDLYALNASVRAGREARKLLARQQPPKTRHGVRWLFAATRRRVTGLVTTGFPGW